jgi:hypothetical protein
MQKEVGAKMRGQPVGVCGEKKTGLLEREAF